VGDQLTLTLTLNVIYTYADMLTLRGLTAANRRTHAAKSTPAVHEVCCALRAAPAGIVGATAGIAVRAHLPPLSCNAA
jgi:hypothetical protein